MFTGIIEEIGVIHGMARGPRSVKLTIGGGLIFSDLKLGDSVAVDGVCLTVAAIDGHAFTADVMPETLDRSALGALRPGSQVNLERAMAADGRFGGHMVSGHIDGTGRIVSQRRDDNAVWLRIETESRILRYVIEKGSLAIDGISLTVAELDGAGFSVSIIPHTAKETTLLQKRPGDRVNLENDLVAKYVERLLAPQESSESASKLTYGFLAEHGF